MTTIAKPRVQTLLIIFAFMAFACIGLKDSLLNVATPSIQATFDIPLGAFGMLFFSGMIGYTLSGVLSGSLMARIGVGRMLALSCMSMGLALVGYALAPGWWAIVLLGLLSGAGGGAIDAGLNTYVATNHSESVMQWLHACFGVGSTLGPLLMTGILAQELSWRWGYAVVGAFQAGLALCFFLTADLWRTNPSAKNTDLMDYKTPARETLRIPTVWLSIFIFFLYTGLEYGTGVWSYTLFTESRGISEETAGLWVSLYWGVFTIGRITAGMLTGRISLSTLLRACMIGSVAGAALLWANPFPESGVIALALIGFSCAPIFPGLISNTPARVGAAHAANTIGFQVGAGSLGIGILPGIAGLVADYIAIEAIGPFFLILALGMFALYEVMQIQQKQENLTILEIGS